MKATRKCWKNFGEVRKNILIYFMEVMKKFCGILEVIQIKITEITNKYFKNFSKMSIKLWKKYENVIEKF